LDNIFNVLKDNKALRSQVKDIEIMCKIKANWEVVVGRLVKDLKPIYVRKKVLHIETVNYMWVNELEFCKKDILERLDQLLTKNRIIDLKIKYVKKIFHKEQIKNNIFDNLSLEEMVKEDNREKIRKGLKLCNKCNEVYTSSGVCVFCSTHNDV
jgi:hypothetical protein